MITVVVPYSTFLLALGMMLRFAKIMVEMSGDTKCLRDVAVLLRAFRAGRILLLMVQRPCIRTSCRPALRGS